MLDAEVTMVFVREIMMDDVEAVIGRVVECVVREELSRARDLRTKRLAALNHRFQQYQLLQYWERLCVCERGRALQRE